MQQRSIRNALGGTNVNYLGSAIGQSARLIKNDRVDGRERLEVQPALDDRTELRGASNRAEDRQRRSRRNATRTGNDDHRNGRAHIVGDQKRESSGSEREVNQIARETICNSLNGSARFFRPLHCIYDLAECSVTPHPVHPNFERAGLIDCSGIDRRSLALLRRHRFASDRCLIHEGVASDNDAVHWNAGPRLHENDLANSDFFRLNVLPRSVYADCGGRGQETNQMTDCRAPAPNRQAFENFGHQNE